MTLARNTTSVATQILMVQLFASNAMLDYSFSLDEQKKVSEICVSPNFEDNSWLIQQENDLEPYHTMLASENVLKKDWESPEEDEAWAHL